MTIEQLCEATGFEYCGEDCTCGDPSGLLYFPYPGPDEAKPWVPGWMNGSTPEDVEAWMRNHVWWYFPELHTKVPT